MGNKSLSELHLELAKKLSKRTRNKDEILKSFISAGILDSNGNFTNNYPILKTNNIKWKT